MKVRINEVNVMNELYEFAKVVDVLILFCFLMGFGYYGVISCVMDIISFIYNKIKKYIIKKQEKKKSSDN